MKLRGLIPNFYIHISVSDLYISRMGLPILLQPQIHECGNWETEHYNSLLEIQSRTVSFLAIHKSKPDIYIGFSPALHLQCGNYEY
jgi:hypothetical protein